jgi:hypothetical protein
MEDPTSDVGEVDPEDAPECIVCEDRIVNSPSHRVLTWVEDGSVEHRHFCSDACVADWSE